MEPADTLPRPAPLEDPSTALSSGRTAMSFERTHLSLDRTLMSVIRTSLSLIGFGFTVFQAFHAILKVTPDAIATQAPRRFGAALIIIGIVLLVVGLLNHAQGARSLRERRARLHAAGLIGHQEKIAVSSTSMIAFLLLAVGLLAVSSVLFRIGPF